MKVCRFNWLSRLTVLLCGLTVLVACDHDRERKRPEGEARVSLSESAAPVPQPSQELVATENAFIAVAHKVKPAVVNISAGRSVAVRPVDPFFRDFFGDLAPGLPFGGQREQQSLGSGFIITPDGYILTNAHVIKGAEQIQVRLADDQIYTGRIVGADPKTDIAVIKIEPKSALTPAVFGDSDRLRVGQWALAIGNPFGLDSTVTVGVVSATGRANVGIEAYEDFIQTDASINPGNSGGPLLNIRGEVIGINTAIVAAGQGIGFAIPANLARNISRQLIEKGDVTRGWLGVSIQPLTPELAQSFGLDQTRGALISDILPGSPAAEGGLKSGDILLSYAGKPVRGVRELQLLVASTPVGESVAVEILRDHRQQTLKIRIAAQEKNSKSAIPARDNEKVEAFGLRIVPALGGGGVVVSRINPASNAAGAGVQAGDEILSVNGIRVDSPRAFAHAASRIGAGEKVILRIRRGDSALYLAFAAD